jgi:hypothetical protein
MSYKTLNCFNVQPNKKLTFPRPGFELGPGQGSWPHSAGRDYCRRRAPVTGVNKGETTLSEIKTVQVLILN